MIDDGNTAEVWCESHPKARKEHRCNGCGATIAVGTVYMRHFSVFDGHPTQERACLACEAACAEFGRAEGHLKPPPGSLGYFLNDCIAEGPYAADDVEHDRWVQLRDELRARRTAATP